MKKQTKPRPKARVKAADKPINVQIGGEELARPAKTPSRDWRDAWKLEGDAIAVCMDKARGLHRARIQTEAEPKCRECIDKWFDAQADGASDADLSAIVARRKQYAAAHLDPRIDEAKSPDDLEALSLSVLVPE